MTVTFMDLVGSHLCTAANYSVSGPAVDPLVSKVRLVTGSDADGSAT